MQSLRWAWLLLVNTFRRSPTDAEIAAAAKRIGQGQKPEGPQGGGGSTGACTIVYPALINGRSSSCTPNMTQADCDLLAIKVGGVAQPVISGSNCQ